MSRKTILQLVAYVLVGFSNTILTVFLYWLFLEVFEWHYILSFTLSWLIGVIFTYIINANRVFRTLLKIANTKRQ